MLALLEMAARGALLLAATGLAALLLRRTSAAVLCLLWSAAAVALLALPAVGLLAPAWELPVPSEWLPSELPAVVGDDPATTASGPVAVESAPSGRVGVTASAPPVGSPSRVESASPTGDRSGAASEPAGSVDPEGAAAEPSAGRSLRGEETTAARISPSSIGLPELVLVLWLAGALLLLGRTLTSLVRGARIVAAARPVDRPELQARVRRLAERLGIRGGVRLLETDAVRVPLIWHLGRPCLLVPEALASWPVRRQESVILHELAHVKRHDCRTWLLARLAVALHWFNPLAWVALAEIRAHRERACDDAVLRAGVRPSSYARHLVSIARSLRGRPAAFAGGAALLRETGLSTRVRAILDPRTGRTSPNRRTVVTLVACILSLLVPVAALHPVAAQAPSPPAPVQGPEEPEIADSPWTPVTGELFMPGDLPVEPTPAATPAARPPAAEEPASAPHAVGATPAPSQEPEPDLDDLVRMRIHDVTPEYARSMRAAFGPELGSEELVKARIHDVAPEDATELGELLGTGLELDDVVRLHIQDVDADFVRAMRELLPTNDLDVDTLLKLRIHDVSPELVRRFREAGYDDLTADELVRIQIHDLAEVMLRRDGGGA